MATDGQSAIVAAEVAALLALLGTVVTAIASIAIALWTQRNVQKLAQLNATWTQQNAQTLAQLNAALGKQKSEEDARRDYEYEARKRLYQECEPLMFQLVELSENALYRIHSLVRSTKQGNLPRWLRDDDYYTASTLYRLLAPVVIYKLLQRQLTTVDLRLDKNIDSHYQLAKLVAWSFSADFDFAWGLNGSRIEYQPNDENWKELRVTDPATYWRQGLPIGRLDNAVESLIIRDPDADGHQRIMSFGMFESQLHETNSQVRGCFSIVRDVITDFHPETRPVLWRMLVAQAHIYDAIVRFQKGRSKDAKLVVSLIPEKDRSVFYWRRNPSATQLTQLNEPFGVAEAFFKREIPNLFQS
jgi:hypothetical protein